MLPRGLGDVFGQDTGFKIESNPDRVRAPDVAFLDRERSARVGRRGYSAVAPSLAVEVLSPDDRPGEVLEKIAAWLSAGVELTCVVDPERRTVRVHRADGTISVLSADDDLSGETVLPGFSCAVREIFD
jgi:Uma2 family endonuclease